MSAPYGTDGAAVAALVATGCEFEIYFNPRARRGLKFQVDVTRTSHKARVNTGKGATLRAATRRAITMFVEEEKA